MKGSTVILVLVVTLGIIQAQTFVQAKSCCKTTTGRICYNSCRVPGTPRPVCAQLCSCKIISGNKCPPDYPKLVLALNDEEELKYSSTHNIVSTGSSTDIISYCKLGCTSSMCSSMITAPQTFTDEEIVRCNKACSYICTKDTSDAGLTCLSVAHGIKMLLLKAM